MAVVHMIMGIGLYGYNRSMLAAINKAKENAVVIAA